MTIPEYTIRYNHLTGNIELFYDDTWNEWVSSGTTLEELTSLYLYTAGEDNTSVTGGYVNYNYKSASSGATKFATPTISTSDTYITFKQSGSYMGTVFTSLGVDLTNYSKIKINRTVTSNGSSNYTCTFGLTSAIKNNYDEAAKVSIKGSGDVYLDISSLSGKYHLYFMLYSATLKIYSISLLK